MPDFLIRPYEAADLPAMDAVVGRAWAPFFHMLQERMGPDIFRWVRGEDWQAAKTGEVAAHCAERPDWCLVAEVEGRVVGFVTFVIYAHRPLGEISNNSVDPDFQGRGIAKALYRRALEIFQEQGCRCAKVVTGTDEPFAAARAAYEKIGFRPMLPHVEYYMELGDGRGETREARRE
jgi:ribosomal protein S18 acetylase RimI-like enzyme